MKKYCPNPNLPEFQELVSIIGEKSAHLIYRDAGDRIPTGDELKAFIERELTQDRKDTNLSDAPNVEDIKNKLENRNIEKLGNEEGYLNTKTGELVNKRVSHLVEEYYRQQGIHWGEGENNRFYALKGTVIHEYQRHILQSIIDSADLPQTQIESKVTALKRTSEEFKDKQDNFFSLTPQQFTQLKQAARDLVSEIKRLQKNIDPKGETKFYLEIPVLDEFRGVAGTIDLLVLFSDGSASMYDYKTFGSRRGESPSSQKIGAWDVQLSNYRNMLKNEYGINKFRHVRVIPINTLYSQKTADGWVNQIEEGFQMLSIQTKENNLEYLDPIPFQEESGDRNYNALIESVNKKRKTIDTLIQHEYDKGKRINLQRQRKRLDKVLKDLQLGKDVGSLFSHLREMVKVTKSKLHLTRAEEGFINEGELVDMVHELQMYSSLTTDFRAKLKDFPAEQRVKLEAQVSSARDYIAGIIEDLKSELLDRMPDDILEAGNLPANQLSRILYGVGNFDVPIFKEFTKLWRGANEMTRRTTLRDIERIQRVDKQFSEWASANGYTQQKKFALLLNDRKQLHSKFNNEFWAKKKELRSKAYKEKLTTEDKKWIKDNFLIDKAEATKFAEETYSDMKHQLEIKQITQKQYDEYKTKFDKYTNPLLVPNAIFMGKHFSLLRPKDNITQYINKDWEFIQKNAPLKAYYDMYTDFNRLFAEVLGKDKISENFVANVEQTITNNLLEHGAVNLREAFLKKFELRQNDALRGRLDLNTGKSLPSIPVMYIDQLRHNLTGKKKAAIEAEVELKYKRDSKEFKDEVEQRIKDKEYAIGLDSKSTDLTKSLMLFAHSVNEFQYMSEIEPMVKALKFLVDTQDVKEKAVDAAGKNIVDKLTDSVTQTKGWDPALQKAFNTFVNRLVYKQKYDSELFNSDKYSSNKVIGALMQWLSIRALGFNFVIGTANFIQGKTSIHMLAKENQFFGKEELKGTFKAFATHDEQYFNVMEHLMPSTRDIIQERIELSGASLLSRRMRSRTFFLGHIKGDDQVDYTITAAMSKRYKVDSDGKIKNPKYETLINPDAPSVYDSVTLNEQGETYIPGLSVEEFAKYRAKIQKISYKAKGMMSEEHKGIYASSILGTMFMQFRTWSVGLAETRFGALKYDPTLETFEIGRFNAALGGIFKHGAVNAFKETSALIAEVALMGLYKQTPNMDRIQYKYNEFLESNPGYRGRLSIEQFQQLQKDKVRGFLAESRMYLSLIVLSQILAGLDWDDEEETNLFTWNAYRVSNRALLEISFWFNPRSVDEIVRSPLPLWGLFNEMTRIIDSSVREVTYIIDGERPAGVKTSPGYYMLRSTPAVNQVLDFFKFFETYNPPKTSIDYVFDMFKDD